MKIAEFKDLLKKIEEHKNNIAKERDELRQLSDELEDLLYSFDKTYAFSNL